MWVMTVALEASFYWAWGTEWEECWVGRAAYWMWGPVEADEVDLEKGEGSFSATADVPFRALKTMILPNSSSMVVDMPFQGPKSMSFPAPASLVVDPSPIVNHLTVVCPLLVADLLASFEERAKALEPSILRAHSKLECQTFTKNAPAGRRAIPRHNSFNSLELRTHLHA